MRPAEHRGEGHSRPFYADDATGATLDAYFTEVAKTRKKDAEDAAEQGSRPMRSSAEYRSRRHMRVAYRLLKQTRPHDAADVLRALLDEGYAVMSDETGAA